MVVKGKVLMPLKEVINRNLLISFAVLPDGNGGSIPCPELLTENEAIRYLRLDIESSADPHRTMKYYRDSGELVAIKVGKKKRYRRIDLDSFLANKSESQKRKLDQ